MLHSDALYWAGALYYESRQLMAHSCILLWSIILGQLELLSLELPGRLFPFLEGCPQPMTAYFRGRIQNPVSYPCLKVGQLYGANHTLELLVG